MACSGRSPTRRAGPSSSASAMGMRGAKWPDPHGKGRSRAYLSPRASGSSLAGPMDYAAAQPVAAPSAAHLSVSSLKGYQVHLRGAHEVVFRQSADGVGAEGDAAVVVADLEVRVGVLGVGEMRQRVHEAHGAIEVPESERAPDGVRVFGQ